MKILKAIVIAPLLLMSVAVGSSATDADINKEYYNKTKETIDMTNPKGIKKTKEIYDNLNIKPNTESFGTGLVGGELILDVSDIKSRISYEYPEVDEKTRKKDTVIGHVTYDGNITVSDFRYSGEGWHLSIQATTLTDHNGKQYPNSIVIASNPTLTASSKPTGAEKVEEPTITDFEKKLSYIDGKSIPILDAFKNEGLGAWSLTLPPRFIEISIPKSLVEEKDSSVSTTITWTLTSGPAY